MWWILAAFVLGAVGIPFAGWLLTFVALAVLVGANVGQKALTSRKQKALA